MMPMKDDVAFSYLKPCHIEVKNERLQDVDYTLVLKIDNNSSLNPKNLNIRINDNIMPLDNLKKETDDLYTYYLIDKGNILEKEAIYDVIFWLKEDAKDINPKQQLIFAFDLMNSSTTI